MSKDNNKENPRFSKLSKTTKEKKNKKLIPLNDHVFKRMFGEKGCEKQLITLINGLTGRTGEKSVKKITIVEKEIPRELYDDKEIRLDILATTDKGEQINIEAQLRNVDMASQRHILYCKTISPICKKGSRL